MPMSSSAFEKELEETTEMGSEQVPGDSEDDMIIFKYVANYEDYKIVREHVYLSCSIHIIACSNFPV